MSKINEFLSDAGVFFMATVDGDRPRLRPLGAHLELQGKVVFGVGDFKEVYRQMQENPMVEICACKPNGHWLRYSGKAIFETDPVFAETMLDHNPGLRNIYNEKTGHRMMAFHLEEAVAREIAVMGEGTDLLAEEA